MKNSAFEADQVITALYEAMLQRRPDPGGLRHYADALSEGASLTEVVSAFLASEEFRHRVMPTLASRFSLDSAPPIAIQVKFTAAERRAVWNHVSEVWSAYGKTDPCWSVLVDERWRSKNLTNEILHAFMVAALDGSRTPLHVVSGGWSHLTSRSHTWTSHEDVFPGRALIT